MNRGSSDSPRAPTSFSVVAFAVFATALVYYALRGGSYDIVPRQQEALAIWWVLAVCFALGLLPRARPPRGLLVPLAAIAVLALWTAISLTWTDSADRTYAEVARVLHYLGLLVLIWAVVDARTWRAAAAGLLTGAVIVCALALGSRLFPGFIHSSRSVRGFAGERLSYPFNYWNAVGAFAVMTMAMAAVWSAHARSLVWRAASLAVVPMCGATAYLTYSRAALIATAVSAVVAILVSRNRWVTFVHLLAAVGGSALAIATIRSHHAIADGTGNAGAWTIVLVVLAAGAICAAAATGTWLARGDERWRLPRTAARIGVAAAAVLVLVLLPTAGHAQITKGWHEFKSRTSNINSSDPASRLSSLSGNRYFIWRSALKAFEHHPLDGTGAGTFGFWWDNHGGDEFLRDAHSLYLEPLAETGLPGGLLTLAFLLGLLVAAVRARWRLAPLDVGVHGALIAAFVSYLLSAGVDWMWESTAVSVLALGAIAVAGAAVSRPAVRPLRPAVRVPLVAFALVVSLLQLPGLVSTTAVRDSQHAFKRGDMASALANANDAIDAEPWAADPYVQRALVEESQNKLASARADLLRAESREPRNYAHPLLLARIDAERGDARASLADLRRARALRPASPFLQPPRS